MDIVRIFQQYAADQGYFFSYGSVFIQNLRQNPEQFEQDKIHLLLTPVRRKSELGEFSRKSMTYTCFFVFALRDNFDLNFFNEKGTNELMGKWTTRIEPMLQAYAQLEKHFMGCQGLSILSSETLEEVDFLDANLTGLGCTMQMRVYE